mmetsp:Transcript_37872/g.55793  ORF Transcript_37872/g.55793 Transcript_37872/m.55793 type:complete len:135 (-) Transcript_37872:133-537(-)
MSQQVVILLVVLSALLSTSTLSTHHQLQHQHERGNSEQSSLRRGSLSMSLQASGGDRWGWEPRKCCLCNKGVRTGPRGSATDFCKTPGSKQLTGCPADCKAKDPSYLYATNKWKDCVSAKFYRGSPRAEVTTFC